MFGTKVRKPFSVSILSLTIDLFCMVVDERRGERLTMCGTSFAFMEMCTIMAKLHWSFETEMVDPGLDWVGKSKMHVQWDKPHLDIRFLPRKG